MTLQQALNHLVEGEHLTRAQMRAVMMQVMTGEATPAQIGAWLVALRLNGETIEEITGAAEVMRELMIPVHIDDTHLIDLVGTGGDGANLFNVSTAATFVVAAAGGRVAKHGNRSVSSSSGSSDVLETLGVSLSLTPAQIEHCISEVGLGFMFAPVHHGAMKHAIGPRRELGLRTLFNILGPLTNPAGVRRQVLGVYDPALCEPLARALDQLGSVHALVLHSDDGLDEISIAALTHGVELKAGDITPITIDPAALGHGHDTLDGLQVSTAEASAALIRSALDNDASLPSQKARSIIALNAGAAIYVSGLVDSLADGVKRAETALASGDAAVQLARFVAFTQDLSHSAGSDSSL
jgi:anthranilate phosphoribosyltransferase